MRDAETIGAIVEGISLSAVQMKIARRDSKSPAARLLNLSKGAQFHGIGLQPLNLYSEVDGVSRPSQRLGVAAG